MNYKVKIVFRDGSTTVFPPECYELANITYERFALKFADHASALDGEWIIAMLNEDNSILKQLKLTSSRP